MTSTVEKLTAELAEAHARIADLEAALGLTNDTLGVAFCLSSAQNKLLGCLMATPNVTPEMMTLRLNIAGDSKVAVHRLRSTLRAYCAENNVVPEIEIQGRRGLGYWLTPADKERIRVITLGVTARRDEAPSEAAVAA